MTGTDLVPALDAGELESDPVRYMAVVLHRAKGWLAEAQNIESVRDTKAIAVGYESVVREKELAFDAQLSATEIVRRCERRIGELVREGQRSGTVRPPSREIGRPAVGHPDEMPKPKDFFSGDEERTASYVLADAPDEQFEQAIDSGREEGNLSRANLVRKIKSETPAPRETPRNNGAASNGGSARPAVVSRIADQAEAMAMAIGALNLTKSCERMTEDERQSALASCKAGLRALNTMARALAASERSTDAQ